MDACLDSSTSSSTGVLDLAGASGRARASPGDADRVGETSLKPRGDMALRLWGDIDRDLGGELRGEDGVGETAILR